MINRKLATAILCACGLFISPVTQAGFFPEAGVDQAPSCGHFVVTFTKKFIREHSTLFPDELVAACQPGTKPPSCSTAQRTIESPLLYEARTKVGRSTPHLHGDSVDILTGAYICQDFEFPMWDECVNLFSAGQVKDKIDGYTGSVYEIPLTPDIGREFDFKGGPKDTDEVHTEVLSLNLTPLWPSWNTPDASLSKNAVRAGLAAPDHPLINGKKARLVGEVESLNPPNSAGGFPAESYFDMFVVVDVDVDYKKGAEFRGVDFQLFNKKALIVQGYNLTEFPPRLIYKHNANEEAVPIYDLADPSGGHVGFLRMAGHGMNFGESAISTWDDWEKFRNGNWKRRRDTRDGENDIFQFEKREPTAMKKDLKEFEADFVGTPMLAIKPDGPISCQLYALQDHGLNHSQFYTVSPFAPYEVEPVSKIYAKHDLEGLATCVIDGKDRFYASSGNNTEQPGCLYTFNGENGEITKIGCTGFNDVPSIAFDSECKLWGWVKGKGIITIDTETGKGTMVKAFPGLKVEDITWNNEGTHIYAAENTNLWVYESATKTAKRACNNLPGETEALEMLPDGSLLLGIHGKGKILQFQGFNTKTCEIVFGVDIPTSPTINDIEGIAWPINACSQP